ncbi:MAG: heparinase II/III family protein [Vicingaceae bacterium]
MNIDDKIINHYLVHEFDLLGSGWVNRNSRKHLGLAISHTSFSQEVLRMVSNEYKFIDWQLDVRSGFRFNVKKQFDNQLIDKSKNVDIKNCWELGRLQHLPQMALAANQYKNNSEKLIVEFKNQSVDFIASNPIGMGVQWACAMDVGIRVCNWLVAFDIFKQADNSNILDEKFTLFFTDFIHRHVEFLMNHLEEKEGAAGNHYLFNLVGVLFATNYLSEKEELLVWRKFAEDELEKEFFKQFFTDGGNFEGSTTYHCLSAEAILYGTAMMLRSGKKISEEYVELLSKTYQFIEGIIKPNGEMPQFGDNDSGRLFVFQKQSNWLNYEFLLAGFSGLFNGRKINLIERDIVKQLSKKRNLVYVNNEKGNRFQLRSAKHQLQKPKTTVIKFESNIDLDKVSLFSYDEFGVYGFKSEEFYLAISAIANKRMHHSWGHVHNDKLSFDLQVHKKDLVRDPGTYTYSAFPDKRNQFRGVEAHNGIVVNGVEQNKSLGLFYLDREVECKFLELKDFSITLQANYYGVEHIRKFTIMENQLIVTDYCNKPFKVNINKFDFYSPNYGSINKD